jgi:P-type Ca2+ transporter type 2C
MVPNSLPNLDSAWHTLDADKTLHQFQTNRTIGLTHQQVADRLQTYGLNELEEGEGRSTWTILIDQFKNIMLLMLIAVALISGTLDLLDLMHGTLKPGDIPFKDTIAILAIVILNGALGYIQESRAEKALAALKQLSSPKVRVLRDHKISEIDSKNLVLGDVMFVEAGVQIAADGRLLEEANLQIRESALTGEAQAVNKQANLTLAADAPLGDRVNLVYQGTEVLQGRGTVVVTGTGMRTELGKIAAMLQGVESEPTPLQLRMDQLSQALVTGALALVAVVVGVGFLAAVVSAGGDINAGIKNLRDLLQVSLSMAVAVVPEGLPAVITVTLAIGTQRMVRRNALIRKLPAVETLGSVTTICSDKTGTLTQNKMVVQSVHTASFSPQVTGEGYIPTGNFYADHQITPSDYPELQALLLACTVCNDSILQTENGQWQILGDPTEGALLVVASKGGFEQDQWNHKLPRVAEFPFSSERKRMSVIVEGGESRMQTEVGLAAPYLMFTKGSPELILERCQQVQIDDRIQPLTDEHRQYVLDRNNQLASKGLRVLGFAYKPLETLPPENSSEQTEQGLVWLGLVDMLDAPRPEVRDAVARCRTAGIRPVMITGDHQLTAMAIAEDLGIAQAGDRVITGRELETISLPDLEQIVNQVSVYARVAPEHKLRIVQALQRQNKIVAMTGDGVNDAPALKQADIGIAMGITGTDVSKEASDMVLLDDNFATIVAATEEGRVVYTNIRRFIKYILGSNIGEVLTIAASPLLLPTGGGVPLSPLQILWMNLVTDGLPALALAVEPAEPNVMQRPPNHPGESIFARGLGSYMVRVGIVLAILSIILMVWAFDHTHAPGYTGDPEAWKTMVFTTLCLAQMGHAIAIRSNTQLSIQISPFTNPYVWAAVGVTTLLQFALIYIEPLRKFFGTHLLSAQEVWVCIGFSMLMFVWIELEKVFINRFKRGARAGN